MQISRSLGHKHLGRYGIVPTPDCYVRLVDPNDTFALLVATDGVTDGLRKAAVLDVLACTVTAAEAASRLCEDAHAASLLKSGRSDDCTAVVLCF